ncbi:uncharacterized protein Z518_05620 [Rhinocladiella mackenziei CBS 650.93]|uniref:C2H2-domain containing protein second zinc finger domain-containing protein n=1 Tax=Rhinocladiella mackenziei CBS 650.93 TaxID=1442369 RepID=A0A0D2J6R1_9EURO|nr:uncharacterized protein Z518_05620 [Rhinocladiella mackenziei CBS 650.93]KIX04750.1 hypothetical protein Z518_05620 [Rhinocladiella mackenziei CBS 650.93]
MPWTIWPALVVLWGVCWMFYDEPKWNWGDQGDLPTTSNTTELFEGIEPADPFQGDSPSSFLSNLDDVSRVMSTWSDVHFAPPNPEQRLQLYVPELATNCAMATTPGSVLTSSVVNPTDAVNPSITNHGDFSEIVVAPGFARATSTIQQVTENERLQTADSGQFLPINTLIVHGQARDEQNVRSRNSKHGQTEKYFCSFSDCSRSQPGSGFYRKDHLNQHLRGLHKQNLVPRPRVESGAASNACKATATNETTGAIVQSKKRKSESEEEFGPPRQSRALRGVRRRAEIAPISGARKSAIASENGEL